MTGGVADFGAFNQVPSGIDGRRRHAEGISAGIALAAQKSASLRSEQEWPAPDSLYVT